ncbi:leukotriene A-4 hydrolase-like isoform X2 [Amphiura filiformis]|uniref:leukotriene A-4 hydrolase-like isoform X2 n=1 Tax=Amphiura filiformis TaxID=82378 RepID=UPI003B21A168
MADRRVDPCTLSTPVDQIVTTKLNLDWDVDFEKKTLSGNVKLDVKILKDGVGKLVLDTRDLSISGVWNDATNEKLTFALQDPNQAVGSALEIQLPSSAQQKESSCCIRIEYQTSPSASALQWLNPAQTVGKKQPYLFSQCQAIHARSLIPCQDTPSVKAPYDAKVTVPRDLVALMSAVRSGEEACSDSAKKTYCFEQKVPIPSYLVAIVVGALESRDIGPRSRVWSEAEYVEKGKEEFSETETMLQTAEALLGPYVWGQYDLLILPPSFPYGGMENPCLTFVTPTLLAGDKSLASVVAHEISHSWTGNLVTNCSWEHMWLNEGFTVFVERKILGRMKGSEKERHFQCIGGQGKLIYAVETFGESHPYTHLLPLLEKVDPDDAFSSIPYEKGSTFLFYLETLVGNTDDFEAFLRAYIEKFKYQSISTQDWKDFLFSYFQDKASVFNEVEWDKWFHSPGMCPVLPKFDTTLSDACTKLCDRWCAADFMELEEFGASDLKGMSTGQVIEFLSQLLLKPALSELHIHSMGSCYKFDDTGNSEIKFRWLRLCIKAGYAKIIPKAIEYACKTGRLKFARPLFKDLYKWQKSRQKAVEAFLENRENMHPITATMVAKDLEVDTQQ